MNNQTSTIRQCEAIQNALTDAFKTLPMSDQLRLNELLDQHKTCAYDAGVRDTAISMGMPRDYLGSAKKWIETYGK